MKGIRDAGAIPANVSVSVLASVTAGLAKLVDAQGRTVRPWTRLPTIFVVSLPKKWAFQQTSAIQRRRQVIPAERRAATVV